MPLLEDIKRPLNLMMLILAVIGNSLALYFYYFPHNEKRIVYFSDGPSLIFNSKLSTPKLHLVDANNIPVKSDAYLQTLTLLNNGSAPIEPTDVRTPVRFVLEGVEQILDYKIVKSIQPEVCCFTLSVPTETNQVSNFVELQWKHFDPKTAVQIQIIFSQSTTPKLSISANILGIPQFITGSKHGTNKVDLILGIPTALFSLLFGGFLIREAIRNKLPKGSFSRQTFFFFGTMQLIFGSAFILTLLWANLFSPVSPF